jgi:hypothetical protein
MQPAQVMVVSQVRIPCPRCGQVGANIRTWSWWGGFVGPKIFKMATCMFCNQDFNHQTGKPITGQNIALYILVPFGIVIGFVVFFSLLTATLS